MLFVFQYDDEHVVTVKDSAQPSMWLTLKRGEDVLVRGSVLLPDEVFGGGAEAFDEDVPYVPRVELALAHGWATAMLQALAPA